MDRVGRRGDPAATVSWGVTVMRWMGLCLCWSLVLSAAARGDYDDAVQTEAGAPLKVVVRRDTALYEGPAKTGRNRPVSMFEFFYVLKPERGSTARTKNGFYRVGGGTSQSLEVGWIVAEDVVEWPHRQALGLRPVGGRERAVFYQSKEDLARAFGASGAKPTPLSREPEGGATDINLVPILERFTMTADGDTVDGFRVAYLHSRSGRRSSSGPSRGEGPAIDFAKSTLDVVFIIDTTGSMQPHIDAAKEAVTKITAELAKHAKEVPLRFGLIGYRDVEDEYVARIFSDLEYGADHTRFLSVLGTVTADGGGDGPEDIFAGMKLAITSAKWNPHAFKHIILMGDAPAHTEMEGEKNRDKLTIEGVVALAQPRGRENVREKITIHAICCHQGTAHPETAAQFRVLSQGEEYPGYYGEFDTKESPQFIQELVLKAMEGLKTVVRGGDVRTLRQDTPGLGLLMEMVDASEAVGGDVPSFASGFCCEIDPRGNQVFEPWVLVQHGRLAMFTSFLEFSVRAIRSAGDAGARDVKKAVQSIQMLATQMNLGEPVTADMPVARLANLILEFPVRTKIFDITFSKLAAMTEADFTTWVRQVETSRSVIQSHLDNPRIWRSLGRDMPLEQRYCFLKMKDLP